MNAQRQAGGGGGGYPGGNSRPPLGKKEQKALKKKQEQDAKTLKELRKNNEKLRNKAAAQRGAQGVGLWQQHRIRLGVRATPATRLECGDRVREVGDAL